LGWFSNNSSETDEWALYSKSKDYKLKINLYENADLNEKFYAGDQWDGVVSNGLPTPVFNIFRRCINYFISAILSQRVKLTFIPENIADESADEQDQAIKQAGELISKYSETLWEKLKMDSNMRGALLDAAISGDMDGYSFWDSTINTGQEIEGVPIEGDISFECVDNVNVHFGNPNDARVEPQPWIIVSFRELVSKLKEEAKLHGAKDADLIGITGDSDTKEQSGILAKIEMEGVDDNGKTTALIKFWKDSKTKTLHYIKSTRACTIVPSTDTGSTKYPVSHGNWDRRKNSCHGQAVGTGLVPNQIFINKMFAMVMLNLMQTAFPKVVYNKSLISSWANQVGQAIGVDSAEDISKVAMYLQPGQMSSQIMSVIDAAIAYTKDLIGVTDAATGNIKADNHAAIIAVQQASFVPLENIKANLYQWVEDIGYIWLDMMIAKYGNRNITITEKGKRIVIPFDFSQLKGIKFQLKVEVGPSSYWSEITAMQTLDNLLRDAKIDFIQYLERVPDGMIPKKEDLLEEIKLAMSQQKPPAPEAPSTSIKFADLPIIGQIQLAAQHGIELKPEDFQQQQQMEQAEQQQKLQQSQVEHQQKLMQAGQMHQQKMMMQAQQPRPTTNATQTAL